MLASVLLLALRILPDSPDISFRQPQLATDGKLVAVAFGATDTVYSASSTDQGRTFSKPVVVSRAGKLSLGMHRGPRIAITPEAIVVSAIIGEKGRGADGDVVSWRSTDGGKTWSEGVRVNDAPGSGREGLHAMASGGGVLFSTWLDLRAKGTRLYGASSRDGGKTWSKNVLVYESPSETICECCHPSAIVDGRGRVTVMFRNSVEGTRDMYIVRSTDGGQSFAKAEKLGTGTWILNACPMDGGAIATNDKGEIFSSWRREKEVYTTAPGSPERRVGAGKDSTIALGRRGTYLAWTSLSGVQALVPGKTEPTLLSAEGGYAQLLVLASGQVLAAWEVKGSLAFELLP